MSAPAAPVTAPACPDVEDGDHDRFAHWAASSEVTRAYVTGEPIMALCGKYWVPTRDPDRFPICPTCAEIKAAP